MTMPLECGPRRDRQRSLRIAGGQCLQDAIGLGAGDLFQDQGCADFLGLPAAGGFECL